MLSLIKKRIFKYQLCFFIILPNTLFGPPKKPGKTVTFVGATQFKKDLSSDFKKINKEIKIKEQDIDIFTRGIQVLNNGLHDYRDLFKEAREGKPTKIINSVDPRALILFKSWAEDRHKILSQCMEFLKKEKKEAVKKEIVKKRFAGPIKESKEEIKKLEIIIKAAQKKLDKSEQLSKD